MFDWKRSCMLLLLGLLLASTTGCSSSFRSSSEAKTASPVPAPTILHDKVEVIPSLDARRYEARVFWQQRRRHRTSEKPDVQKPI